MQRREEPPDVTGRIRSVLADAVAARALPAGERAQLARDLERVISYLERPPSAVALDDVPTPPPTSGADTGRVGDTFASLEDKVDFPAFVSKLVTGVFDSIVNSSIKQMTAYKQMLESVSASLEDYANDQIPDSEARSYLLTQCPGLLTTGADGKLQKASGASEDGLRQKLGYVPELTSDQNERELVNRARVRLAQQKQKLLATMMLMGINRIVITDGQINASVLFDVSAHESASAAASATGQGETRSQDDTSETSQHDVDTATGNITWPEQRATTRMQVSTFKNVANEDAAETIDAKAKLSGRVKINFKSQTFPLDKFDPAQLTRVMGVARPRATSAPATAPAAPTPTPSTDPGGGDHA